jgi:hypothetical protein
VSTERTDARPWVVFELDEVLLDPGPGRREVVLGMSGATADDLAALQGAARIVDDWDLARAAHAWVQARRPRPIPTQGWRAVVNHVGGDPGDISARCVRLYLAGAWERDAPRVDAAGLAELARLARIGAWSQRSRPEILRGGERLGVAFEGVVGAGQGSDALRDLAPRGMFVGRTDAARAFAAGAGWTWVSVPTTGDAVIAGLLQRLAPASS